ncbi:MAG: helix-turn-helix domain-containing protein [Halanaeroarchaeum sp.]
MPSRGSAVRPPLEDVVSVLRDEDCREILTTCAEPTSARAIASATGVPLSTTYRKLGRLSAASLVDERIVVDESGNETTLFRTDFDTVTIQLTDGPCVDVTRTNPATESSTS